MSLEDTQIVWWHLSNPVLVVQSCVWVFRRCFQSCLYLILCACLECNINACRRRNGLTCAVSLQSSGLWLDLTLAAFGESQHSLGFREAPQTTYTPPAYIKPDHIPSPTVSYLNSQPPTHFQHTVDPQSIPSSSYKAPPPPPPLPPAS